MGFTEAIRTCLQEKYATFQGRASRSEYWYFMLFCVLGYLVLGLGGTVLAGGFGQIDSGNFSYMAFMPVGLFFLAMFLPSLSVGVRRLHDRDMSGWWYLGFIVASNIPFVGIVVQIGWLVLNCLKGTEGPNRFGDDPLGAANRAEVFS